MSINTTISEIKNALETAPRNAYVAELHLQIIKHYEDLGAITGKEFCEALGIGPSFGTEFSKMRKIAPRLKLAGLDLGKI